MYTSNSPEDTEALGGILGGILKPGDVIALEGPLGSGKTCLARGLLLGLGIGGYIRSPSFSLVHQYRGRLPAYHLDVYRLDDVRDMDDLDYEEYFYGEGVTVVEWAERIKGVLPHELLWITLAIEAPTRRRIVLKPYGRRYSELLREVSCLVGARA